MFSLIMYIHPVDTFIHMVYNVGGGKEMFTWI